MEENKVSIRIDEYVKLIENSKELSQILDCLFENTKLGYNNNELDFKYNETLENFVKIVEKERYNKRLKELQEEE